MESLRRYPRLLLLFARQCLVRDMGFRTNFIARCVTNIAWIVLLACYFQLIYGNTERIGDWTRWEYLFFFGTGVLVNAFVDTFFVDNCNSFSELVRTGDLDFALAKPVDEQFLLTLQKVDWAESFNFVAGLSMLGVAIAKTGTTVTFGGAVGYAALVLAGVALMYSVLVLLASSSVWLVRNQALYELWWYVAQFARYPGEIYKDGWLGVGLKVGLSFVLPILLAINVPARVGFGKLVESWVVWYLFAAAAGMLVLSRVAFRFALRRYRSASS